VYRDIGSKNTNPNWKVQRTVILNLYEYFFATNTQI
jgi:hypothetical protein